MKNKLLELLQDNLAVKLSQGFIIMSFVYLSIIVWKWNVLPPELPLYYSLPRGADQLGMKAEILILPGFSVILYFVHFILAVAVYRSNRLAANLLLISALAAGVALLLTFIKIILLIS